MILDNRQLPINRKQKVFSNGTLIIENVERSSDQATYTCVARNAQGHTAKGNLEVQVMGMLIFYYTFYTYSICSSYLMNIKNYYIIFIYIFLYYYIIYIIQFFYLM